MVWSLLSIAAGSLLTLLVIYDAIQTILHPDLDGWLTKRINRLIWRAFALAARISHRARRSLGKPSTADGQQRSLRSWAGPIIVIADVALWMVLPIVGFALIVFPYFPTHFTYDATIGSSWSVGERILATLYYTSETFTTLGYGDFSPKVPGLMVWSMLAPLTGLLVVGLSIAYVIAVFEGVDARDSILLRMHAECGTRPQRRGPEDDGRLDGVHFIVRAQRRDPASLHASLDSLAKDVRNLHGHLYRFHGLAFYLRTHAVRRGPERLMRAFADATLAARILAQGLPAGAPHRARSVDSSEHLEDSFVRFADAIMVRGGHEVTPDDIVSARNMVSRVTRRLREDLGTPLEHTPADEAELVRLACFRVQFLAHVRELSCEALPAQHEDERTSTHDASRMTW